MKRKNETHPVFDYNAMTELACSLWQKQGCCFGQYVTCLHQATEQLLTANQIGNGHAKRGKTKELVGKRANVADKL
jgi:hypothetical protein